MSIKIQGQKLDFQQLMGGFSGAILIILFGLIFSHEIFFSDRWDQYTIPYTEVWFFLMFGAAALTYLISCISHKIMEGIIRIAVLIQIIVLLIASTELYPWNTSENAYTVIGWYLADHRTYLTIVLTLSTTIFSGILLNARNSRKLGEFKPVSIENKIFLVLLVTILGGFCGIFAIISFGYQGFLILFCGLIGFSIVYFILDIILLFDKRERKDDEVKKPVTPLFRRNQLIMRIFYILFILAIIFGSLVGLDEKGWRSVPMVAFLIFPIVEFIIIFIRMFMVGIKNLKENNKDSRQSIIPLGYGNVFRIVICQLSIGLVLLVSLLGSDYYRYIVESLGYLLIAVLGTFVVSSLIFHQLGKRNVSIVSILNLGLLIGLGIFFLIVVNICNIWGDFADVLNSSTDPNQFYILVRSIPFFGWKILVLGGISIGILLFVTYVSIQKFDQEGYEGDAKIWEGNSKINTLFQTVFLFYIGEFYFDNRIFEWSIDYLPGNMDGALEILDIFYIVIIVFFLLGMLGFIVALIRKSSKSVESHMNIGTRSKVHSNKISAVIILAICASPILISGVGQIIPFIEPDYRILYLEGSDFTLWETFSYEKVTSSYRHGIFMEESDILTVTLVRGETERIHYIVSPHIAVEDLKLNFTIPIHETTDEDFPDSGLNWYYVTYNFNGQEEHLIPGNESQYRGRENITTSYTDTINHWNITANINQPLWLSFSSVYNTTPGIYEGKVNLSWKIGTTIKYHEIPLSINVVDYQKPLKYRFTTAFGTGGSPTGMLGRSLWRHGRMGYEPDYEEMQPKSFIKSINWSSGEFETNYTDLDNALETAAKVGYTRMRFTWYPGNQNQSVGSGWEYIPRFSAKWNSTVLDILANASDHLSNTYFDLPYEQGTIRAIDMLLMDLYDEPGKDDAWRIIRYGSLLDQAAPEWKLMCTTAISYESVTWENWTGPGGMFGVIDIRVQMPGAWQQWYESEYIRDLYEEYPAELWVYWINSPWPPYPNSAQAYNPGTAIYSQLIQYYSLTNVSGFLFWTAGDDVWADGGDGYEGWGSGRYFYKTDDGSNDFDVGYRFELIDDAMEIAEMLRHVDAIANDTGESEIVRQDAREIRSNFKNVFYDFFAYPRIDEIQVLDELRTDLIAFLVENT